MRVSKVLTVVTCAIALTLVADSRTHHSRFEQRAAGASAGLLADANVAPKAVSIAPDSSAARRPVVTTRPVRPHRSPPAASFPALPQAPPGTEKKRGKEQELGRLSPNTPAGDAALVPPSSRSVPPPLLSFDGISSADSRNAPPDTVGDVGQNNYVQMVNVAWQVWDKSGNALHAPMRESTPWLGAPRRDTCRTRDQGDPVVVYDQYANRWVLSFFAFRLNEQGEPARPFYECIAVSNTSNPLGRWCAYSFRMDPVSGGGFPDYPHFGVWPDGYYMTANVFTFRSGGVTRSDLGAVFERSKMLRCRGARVRGFRVPGVIGMLPSDADGPVAPPAGSPNYMVVNDPRLYALRLYRFRANWSSRRAPRTPTYSLIPIARYDPIPAMCPEQTCIPQPGTTVKLHALDDRLMNRLVYRNFGDHQSLLLNNTANAASPAAVKAGVRWYELRNPGGAPSVVQQATYAPDANSRWIGSAAFDKVGDIALMYNVSSSTVFPSLRYTARAPSDPSGSLGAGEGTLVAGGGSITSGFEGSDFTRWGDYAALTVDPTDDCRFWFTGEYLARPSGPFDWNTRIGSFKLPTCA
jgi:hypothetical protein